MSDYSSCYLYVPGLVTGLAECKRVLAFSKHVAKACQPHGSDSPATTWLALPFDR